MSGSGNIDARLLFEVADDNQGSRLESGDYFHIQTGNHVTNRPFSSQGLEIYIVL
jgi:hypothetical protein